MDIIKTDKYFTIRPFASSEVDEIMRQEGAYERFQNRFSHLIDLDKLHAARELTNSSQKIPPIFHNIWITSPTSPREIRQCDIETVISNSIKTQEIFPDRKYILWTNGEKLIPASLQALAGHGIEIHNISELGTYSLSEEVKRSIKNKEFAQASDILRAVLVQKYGGVYLDLDYTIYNHKLLDEALNKFELVLGKDELKEQQYFGNAFIAAKPNHPVLQELTGLIKRNMSVTHEEDLRAVNKKTLINIHSGNVPDYIKYPANKFSHTITKSGPTALTVAYYKKANLEKDAAFKAGIILSWPGSGIGLSQDEINFRKRFGDVDIVKYKDKNFWKDLDFNYNYPRDSSNPDYREEREKGKESNSNNNQGYANTSSNKVQEQAFYNRIGNDSYGATWVHGDYYHQIDYPKVVTKDCDKNRVSDDVLDYYLDRYGNLEENQIAEMLHDLSFNIPS